MVTSLSLALCFSFLMIAKTIIAAGRNALLLQYEKSPRWSEAEKKNHIYFLVLYKFFHSIAEQLFGLYVMILKITIFFNG